MNFDLSATLNIRQFISDERCYQMIREMRWPREVSCPWCDSVKVIKYGKDEKQPYRQKYLCKKCEGYFDDLTKTIFAGHHQPLSVWILCLYFMGLNLSNNQIAQELSINKDDVQQMTSQLREGIVAKKERPILSNEVECDEVYIVAGHKGNPEAVKKSP